MAFKIGDKVISRGVVSQCDSDGLFIDFGGGNETYMAANDDVQPDALPIPPASTLNRDAIALEAMKIALLTEPEATYDEIAVAAYCMADGMIAASKTKAKE